MATTSSTGTAKATADLAYTLAQYPIMQLNDPGQTEDLIRSLKKGNAQQVTIEKDGQTQKYYLVAEPQYKQVNIYDSQMKSVKREPLQKHYQEQEQSRNKKQGHKQDAEEKSRSRKRTVTP